MSFIFIYNLFQIPNVAWSSYLQLDLKFPTWVIGLTVLFGSIMTFCGVLAYKYYYFQSTWKNIYIYTTLLLVFFSYMQLMLIFGVNKRLGISDYVFSMGDDVLGSYITGIQLLPICVMYMSVCPAGAEGASYAMLTTFSNVALPVASSIGTYMAEIWNVSNEALENHDTKGLWRLSLLTSIISILPLYFLYLLPDSHEEQVYLRKDKTKSKLGGLIFLGILIISLFWVVLTSILQIL
jgi:hypothetical protein